MAILPIKTFGDPVLRERCKELKKIDSKTGELARNLLETMYANNGLGLAANQIGVVERVFVYDVGEGPVVCINPRIVEESDELLEEGEGCLSLPGVQIPIRRPQKVEIEYIDLKGGKRKVIGEGLLARLFKHEIDHLEGSLLLDWVGKEVRAAALKILNEAEQ